MRKSLLACMLAAVASMPVAALAHGKVGLWSSTTTMSMEGMPPRTMATTFCMTSEQVKADVPPSQNPDCAYKNVHNGANSFSADLVCKGQVEASGHIDTTYDSDTHYKVKMSMQTQGITMNNAIEGHWVKADCAGAAH